MTGIEAFWTALFGALGVASAAALVLIGLAVGAAVAILLLEVLS